ncbi:MAG: periplasmic heavy metal sensor [Candidatus Brocadiae bacterium]|nr:periplasmic heavy metal sensor [Candidatus Brocadiia bacterium]
MTKAKAVLLVCVVLVFAAGAAVGRLTARHRSHGGRRSWLTGQLDLTPEQGEKMREIWSEAMEPLANSREERQRVLRERDEAVRGLLDEDQVPEYDRIHEELAARLKEMGARRREAFEEAVARTREILTPDQRVKYDEMHSRGRRGRFGPGRRGPDRAQSAPGPADPADTQGSSE